MLDLLLPSTDGGVAIQLAIWLVLTAVALWFTRNNNDFRLLAVGLSILTFGIMAIRAIH